MTAQRRFWAAFALAAAATLLCYFAFDRPMSHFAHDHLGQPFFVTMQRIPDVLAPLAALCVLVGMAMILSGRTLLRWQLVALSFGLSLLATSGLKDYLKYAFGRTWPDTWTQNNPSLIRDGAFGFNPFHGGSGYASFPSGHTAVVCAGMTVLWVCWPRFRPLYALLVAATVIGLLGANYHFLSDIVAGGFLGTCVALVVTRLAGLAPVAARSAAEAATAETIIPPARS
jgi:membrane-associated phospholipid phosphatase